MGRGVMRAELFDVGGFTEGLGVECGAGRCGDGVRRVGKRINRSEIICIMQRVLHEH